VFGRAGGRVTKLNRVLPARIKIDGGHEFNPRDIERKTRARELLNNPPLHFRQGLERIARRESRGGSLPSPLLIAVIFCFECGKNRTGITIPISASR